jgi:hypothetical protein
LEAARVTVSAGQEQAGIDFPLLLVPTARVRGVVAGAGADADTRGTVLLIPEEAGGARRVANHRTRIDADSSFTLEMVPPGRYLVVATAGAQANRLYAVQSVVVSGENVDGLALTLAPGSTIGGVVRFEGASGPMAAELSQLGIGLGPVDPFLFGGSGTTRKEADGTFRVSGIPPGQHVLRVGAPKGWTVRSVMLEGRDISEEILDVKAAQTISGVEVVLSDRGAQVTGGVTGEGEVTGSTVVIFPADSTRWLPQSRRIRTSQVDREGRYTLDGLAAGDYLIAAIEDVEQGEWLDPAFLETISAGATRISLTEGARETKGLKLTTIQ